MKKAGEITLGEIFTFPIENLGQLVREVGKVIIVFMITWSQQKEE